jgi:hypothetical protein
LALSTSQSGYALKFVRKHSHWSEEMLLLGTTMAKAFVIFFR